MPAVGADPDCQLCGEEKLSFWYADEPELWIADCTICSVPMVVWRTHDANPPAEVKARLHARLAEVVAEHFDYEHYVDDDMRNIPDHYHAHARVKGQSIFGTIAAPPQRRATPGDGPSGNVDRGR